MKHKDYRIDIYFNHNSDAMQLIIYGYIYSIKLLKNTLKLITLQLNSKLNL